MNSEELCKNLKFIVPPGRLLFSAIFIQASFGHFSAGTAQYAALQGVPFPGFLVPVSGVMALVGGLSILMGYKARVGALLIALFLIPVTLMMHNFWVYEDPAVAHMQQINFMKNLAMLGGAFLVIYFGAGPVSLDERAVSGLVK